MMQALINYALSQWWIVFLQEYAEYLYNRWLDLKRISLRNSNIHSPENTI